MMKPLFVSGYQWFNGTVRAAMKHWFAAIVKARMQIKKV
jgi:hypothetical protein